MKEFVPNRIIISRTDSIGDVILTLPLCQAIKEKYPDCTVIFLGADYTLPVVNNCPFVDETLSWTNIQKQPTSSQLDILRDQNADVILHVFPNKKVSDLAKKVKIKHRVGTSHRAFHLLTCNHKISFTRKRSDLHESQLNFHLAAPLGLHIPSFSELKHARLVQLEKMRNHLEQGIVLHPKSKGSAMEWPIEKYVELAEKISNHVKVYVSGTEAEGQLFRESFRFSDQIIDVSGKFTLEEFQAFIASQKALVACSTGPLHIAGAIGIGAIGLYTEKRPMHPGRWQPLGGQSSTLTSRKECPCKKSCTCVDQISVDQVYESLTPFIR